MNPTEGAFMRLCRSISVAAIEENAIATLRTVILAALLAEAERALSDEDSRS